VCRFCVDQVQDIDYKQIQVLRTFTTERGKILARRVTGVCAGHQRQLARCIKRARVLSLLPFVSS
jgi:small subunit ribosomal protein S18